MARGHREPLVGEVPRQELVRRVDRPIARSGRERPAEVGDVQLETHVTGADRAAGRGDGATRTVTQRRTLILEAPQLVEPAAQVAHRPIRAQHARSAVSPTMFRQLAADIGERMAGNSLFRRFLASRRIGYVAAIPRSQPIHNGTGSARADTLVAGAPPQAWKRLSAGEGSKGQRLHDWAMAALPGHEDRHDASRWPLIRRTLSDPQELAFFLCAGPDGTTIETLVRIAGTRWAIETCFKDAKGETGLDQYQVRRYHSWYRHITLSMMAYASLTVTAATDPKAAATWSPSAQQRSAVSWYT